MNYISTPISYVGTNAEIGSALLLGSGLDTISENVIPWIIDKTPYKNEDISTNDIKTVVYTAYLSSIVGYKVGSTVGSYTGDPEISVLSGIAGGSISSSYIYDYVKRKQIQSESSKSDFNFKFIYNQFKKDVTNIVASKNDSLFETFEYEPDEFAKEHLNNKNIVETINSITGNNDYTVSNFDSYINTYSELHKLPKLMF